MNEVEATAYLFWMCRQTNKPIPTITKTIGYHEAVAYGIIKQRPIGQRSLVQRILARKAG